MICLKARNANRNHCSPETETQGPEAKNAAGSDFRDPDPGPLLGDVVRAVIRREPSTQYSS